MDAKESDHVRFATKSFLRFRELSQSQPEPFRFALASLATIVCSTMRTALIFLFFIAHFTVYAAEDIDYSNITYYPQGKNSWL